MLPYKHTLPHRRKILKRGFSAGGRTMSPDLPRLLSYPAITAPPPGFAVTGMTGPKPGSVEQARKDYTAKEWQAI
jgi:hypothetical protein